MSTAESQTSNHLPPCDEPTAGFHPVGTLDLSRRLGQALFRQRLHEQAYHAAGVTHHEDFFRWIDHYVDFDRFVARTVKMVGCFEWGYRNFKDIRIIENSLYHPRLPPALNGFRILQLSDIHLDLDPRILTVIQERLKRVEYDIAVITGDFRNTTDSDHGPSVKETLNLLPCFNKPLFGVLGNHDFIEIVPQSTQVKDTGLLSRVYWS